MAEFQIVERVGARPENVPVGWRVFNAPRPLRGHRTWQGQFISGVFYAAVNPDAEYAEAYVESNRRDAAIELQWISPEQWRERVMAYGRRLADEYGIDLEQFDYADIETSYRNYLRQTA
jgi:phage terminase large subunit-like protein